MSQYHNIFQEVKPALEHVETLRIEALKKVSDAKKIVIMIAVLTLAIAVIAMCIASTPVAGMIVAIIGIFAAFLTYSCITSKAIKAYQFHFKDKLVRAIASAIEPSTIYYPFQGISESTFKNTGHYQTGIDRYHSEDCFEAKIGDTHVQFSEIHAEYKTTSTDSKGRTTKTWHDIFKGVLFIADFHKNFNTWMIIKPDNETFTFFGWLSKKIQGMSSSHIRMEDPEFEEHFKVNAGDDQEARYLLTPDMQQRLIELSKSHGSSIIISLKDSNVYITAPCRKNFYEPNIKMNSMDEAQVMRIAHEIDYYFNIVKILNLNTRIWTKI
jgi:hypothetical protein